VKIFIIMKMKFQLNRKYISRTFIQKLSPELVTIILNDLSEFPLLRDNMGYLAIKISDEKKLRSPICYY
jgi:polyphosphate kinase